VYSSQKDFHKKLLGRRGEVKVKKFLKKKGYKILECNYKTKFGEIDIIALDKETIVFVEVKTRSSDAFGTPSEAVTFIKQKKYKKVAEEYLQKNASIESACRFDVVEVLDEEINHIKNAFFV